MRNILNNELTFPVKKFGLLVLKDESAIENISQYDSFFEEKKASSINIEKHSNEKNPDEYYKIWAFIKKEYKLIPVIKYVFINYPNSQEEHIRDSYFYMLKLTKEFYSTHLGSFCSRLIRFIFWCNVNFKPLYTYFQVNKNKNDFFRYNACTPQATAELFYNSDLKNRTSIYLPTYENFLDSGNDYSILILKDAFKSITTFYDEGFIDEPEFSKLKNYKKELEKKNAEFKS